MTETKISSVVSCDRADIQRAIKSASVAQKLYYKSTTGAQRGVLLRKWYDLIVANVEDCKFIAALLSSDDHSLTGKWRQFCALRMARRTMKPKGRSSTQQASSCGSQRKPVARMAIQFRLRHQTQRSSLSSNQ